MTEYLYQDPRTKQWVVDPEGPITSREGAVEAFLCRYHPHYQSGYVTAVFELRDDNVIVDRNSITHFFWSGANAACHDGPGYIINRTDLANARQK